MPTHANSHLAIETRFQSNWSNDDVPIRFEQDPRKKPSSSFLRLSVRNLRALEVGYSGDKILYRRPGWIHIQCLVPVGKGTQVARDLADTAIAVFEGQQFSGITCRESEIKETGDDGKGFWQVVAKIYFDHDYEVTKT